MRRFLTCSPYAIHPRHPFAALSMLLMALAAAVRCVYYAMAGIADVSEGVIYLGLPVAAALFLIVLLLVGGDRYVALSSVSVLLGVVFFAVKATTFESRLHTSLCLCLYAAVLVLFTLTVFGVIPTKVLLYPLFALPLLYHIFVEDMQIYVLASPRPPALAWLPEISVLLIMSALLSLSLALRRKEPLAR